MSAVRCYVPYTENTPYVVEAERAVASFAAVGVTLQTLPYDTQGNWMKNCLRKPSLLWAEAEKYPRDAICCLDADMRALQQPPVMLDFEGDVAAYCTDPKAKMMRRYMASILIFGPSSGGRATLRRWKELCETDPLPERNVREQVYLCMAIEEAREEFVGFEFVNLGPEYRADPRNHGPNAVLAHHECSRYHIKKIGGSLYDPTKEDA